MIEYRFIYGPEVEIPSSEWEPCLPGLDIPTWDPVIDIQFREVPDNWRHDMYRKLKAENEADLGIPPLDFGTAYQMTDDEFATLFDTGDLGDF